MLADSGLLQQLEHYAFSGAGEPMALYGDPAYPLHVHLQVPYRCDIINYFTFLDFKKKLENFSELMLGKCTWHVPFFAMP